MSAEALRAQMVRRLVESGTVVDPAIESAFASVPREIFLSQLAPELAYADRAVAILERAGSVVSSVSQPSMIARMLELLAVQPGNSILEIGTGSGYNAALLRHLTGKSGRVVSIDIEADLIAHARSALDGFGFVDVEVRCGDGNAGAPDAAPFDRIVVTAAADDIAEAWWEQLASDGRVVVPLAFGNEQWAIGFARDEHGLRSYGASACAFVPLRPGSSKEGDTFYRTRVGRYAFAHGMPIVRALRTRDVDFDHAQRYDADTLVVRPATTFIVRWS